MKLILSLFFRLIKSKSEDKSYLDTKYVEYASIINVIKNNLV